MLFPVEIGTELSELSYAVPDGTVRHLVTGLVPGERYDTETATGNGTLLVTIKPGAAEQADDAGVLGLDIPA